MTRVVLRAEGLYRDKAAAIAAEVRETGGWPVRVPPLEVRATMMLQLDRRDGGTGVLD